MLRQHREHDERAQKQRYADAARKLRRWSNVTAYNDATVQQLGGLLRGAAVVLEAASFNLPAGQLERSGVDALAAAVNELVAEPQ